MNKFLGLESKFYKIGTWFGDMAVLLILWMLCSLPIITFGASTTAVFYVTTRQISNREGYISSDFFKSFGRNFIQATIATLILLGMLYIEYINIMNMQRGSLLFPLQFVLLFEIIGTYVFLFPLLARFDMKLPALFKMAFMLANRHLLTTFSCILLMGVGLLLIYVVEAPIYMFPLFFMVLMGVYAPLTSFMFMNIFRKYQPDLDKDENDDESFTVKDDDNETE